MSLFAAMAAFAVSALRACADHTVNLCVAPQWNVKVRHLTFCSAVGCTANSKIQDVYVWASDVDDGSGLCGAAFLADGDACIECVSVIHTESVHLHSLTHFDSCGCTAFLVLVSLRPMLRTMLRYAEGHTGTESRVKVRQCQVPCAQ